MFGIKSHSLELSLGILLSWNIPCLSYAQAHSPEYYPARIEGCDTIIEVCLPPVLVLKPLIFKNERQERRYSKLLRDVRKTLPFAKLAAQQLSVVSLAMDTIADKKEQKKFIKQKEQELLKEHEHHLRRFTYSQGRLLIKLIDRECEQSSYTLIKTFRGGFSAFLWQTLARTIGANLKTEYDLDDDYLIEHAVLIVEAESF